MVDLYTQGYPYVIFDWCLLALITPFVFVRLYVQLSFRRRPWREIFVLAAWLLYLGYTVCISVQNEYDYFNYEVDWSSMPDSESTPALKAMFWNALFYKNVMYCCKAALLCLYLDLTPRYYFPKTWWAIIISGLLCFIGGAFQILYDILVCRPLNVNWTLSLLEVNADGMAGSKYCWHEFELFETSWALHLSTDLMVYLLPIAVLRNIRLNGFTPRQKRGAFAMFALGFMNIATAIVIVTMEAGAIPLGPIGMNAVDILYSWQAGSAVIIICVPYCRRFWKDTKAPHQSILEMADVEEAATALAMSRPSVPTRKKLHKGIQAVVVEEEK